MSYTRTGSISLYFAEPPSYYLVMKTATKRTGFQGWLNTFLSEKGINMEETLEVEGPSGTNWMPVGVLVSLMNQTSAAEQAGIKAMLVRIDFKNAPVRPYLRHLAGAVAL